MQLKNIQRNLTMLVLGVFLTVPVVAQKITKEEKKQARVTKKNKPPEKGDVYFSPFPVIGANPAFGFIYGAGASVSSYLGDPASTKLSSALLNFNFTTKQQTIIKLTSTFFLKDNDFILMGDWRYLNSSQLTWGLGTGPNYAEEDRIEFKLFRLYETVLKKVGDKGFYAGLGLNIDVFSDFQDELLDLTSDPQVVTPFYTYNELYGFGQEESSLIGLTLNAVYDTRDNINNPYSGRYAFAAFKVNPSFLGSDQSSTSLWLEYRDYFNITPNHNNIIAVWTYGNFTTSGNLPYMNLPAIGWDQYGKSGEPYAEGRFRGFDMVYLGVEYRKHLIATKKNPKFFGAILFANATTANGENAINLFEYIEPGYGLGLRFNMNKKARTNIGVDYGWGNYGTTGLFLRLNETF